MSMSFKASPDGTYGEILVNGQVVTKLPVSGNAVIPNLVGTVSQSGGIPTGAIIERGSNANGNTASPHVYNASTFSGASNASVFYGGSTGATGAVELIAIGRWY